jgi:protein-S-isoprenylcysteine O-methyltransferase Ste14
MLAKMLMQLIMLILVMGALVFAAAGTPDYWQAWLFLACYFTASLIVSTWLIRYDPALLERRMRGGPLAETEPNQRIIMAITSLGFIAGLVVPGLDRRFGWSDMPAAVSILGDVFHLAGWLGILIVFRANSFAAATIRVEAGQKVVSTGPYAIVRHPMYSTALLMIFGIPVALGSWWGLLVFVALVPALAWRLIDEERVLLRDLEGYSDYRRRVRFRLIPLIW